jgi:zinc transporter ZupT
MDSFILKIYAAIVLGGLTFGTGLFFDHRVEVVKKYKNTWIFQWEALLSGLFLGLALLHLMPNLHEMLQKNSSLEWANLLVGVTFLFLLWLEHLGQEYVQHKSQTENFISLFSLLVFSLHALFEGFALGGQHDFFTDILIFIILLGHKWLDVFICVAILHQASFTRRRRCLYIFCFSAITPLGIWFGVGLPELFAQSIAMSIVTVMLAIAAGTFLYIGTLHGLKKSVLISRCCNLNEYLWVVIGYTVMAVALLL